MAPTLLSRRVPLAAGVNQPEGLCEFGHQGLYHDEESGLIHNRARALHPALGRFLQREPKGYDDGANLYQANRSCPVWLRDSRGLSSEDGTGNPGDWNGEWPPPPSFPYQSGIGYNGQPYYIAANSTFFILEPGFMQNPREGEPCTNKPAKLVSLYRGDVRPAP